MKLDVALTLRLVDRLTRPLRDPTRATEGMGRAAEAGVAALSKFGGTDADLRHFRKLTEGADGAGRAISDVAPRAMRGAEQIGRLRGDIDHYRALKREVVSTDAEMAAAQQRAARLAGVLARARNQSTPNDARINRLAGAFERAKDAAGRLKRAQQDQRESLELSRRSLREAGVDTRNLNRDTRELSTTTDLHAQALDRQQRRAGRIDGARGGLARADGMIERNAARRDGLRGSAFEAGALGYGAMRFMAGAGQAQSTVTDIGITADIPVARREELAANVGAVARDAFQPRAEILGAMSQLAAAGLDFDTAEGSLLAIGRTATAANASVPDIGVAAIATLQNLNVPVEQLARSFDMMTMGGAIGRFELRDMAAKFESFTALGTSHGITGQEGLATHIAAAQISRRAAGSSDQAATNYENFLSKISSPDTISNFGNMDVDLLSELRQGDAAGKNRLDTIIELTMDLTGGDTAMMQELFRDQQAFKFVNQMVKEYDLYRDWKTQIVAAEGTTDRFFDDRTANDPTLGWRRFGGDLTGVRDTIAKPLLPILSELIERVDPFVQRIGEWIANNHELVGTIAKVMGGLLILKVGMIAVGFAASALLTPLLLLWKGFALARLGMALMGGGGAVAGLLARLAPLARRAALPLARLAGSAAGFGYVLARGLIADVGRFGRALGGLKGMRGLRLSSLVAPVRWTLRLLPPVPWKRLKSFRLASLVRPLSWVARLLPAISWGLVARRSGTFGMNANGWGRLIKPLKWFGRGALRLIPGIGWAVMAAEIGMFAWSLLGLKPLDWSAFIDRIGWGEWFDFEWKDLLPEWDWSAIVSPFKAWWSGQDTDVTARVRYDGAFDGLGGAVEIRRPGEDTGRIVKPSPRRPISPSSVDLGNGAGLDSFLSRNLDGERRAGGPVWPGGIFKVGEEGEELFIPDQAGTIIPARLTAMLSGMGGAGGSGGIGRSGRLPGMLAAMMIGGAPLAMASPVPALEGLGALAPLRIDARPPLDGAAARSAAPGGTVIERGAIVINAAPGQDAEEIANAVMRRIEAKEKQGRRSRRHSDGDLHDGRVMFE